MTHHDDGWIEAERSPLLDEDCAPVDFTAMPVEEHTEIWRRSVELAGSRDPYAGLVVALHALSLYRKHGGGGAEAAREKAFIEELDARCQAFRETLAAGDSLERAAIETPSVDAARDLIGVADALSLLLLGAIGPIERSPPLPFGERSAEIDLDLDAGELTLDPWPLAVPELTVSVMATRLPRSSWPDRDAFERDWRAAGSETLRWRVSGRSAGR